MVITTNRWQVMAHRKSTHSLEPSAPFQYSSLVSLISAANSVVGWWHRCKVVEPEKPYFGFATNSGSQLGWEDIYDVYGDKNLEVGSNEQLVQDTDLDNSLHGDLEVLQDSLQDVMKQVHPDLLQDQVHCDYRSQSPRACHRRGDPERPGNCSCPRSVSADLSSFSRNDSKRISLSRQVAFIKQQSLSKQPSLLKQYVASVQASVAEQEADGRSQSAEGRSQSADGRSQSADGRSQSADGRSQSADGRSQSADGRSQSADGRSQFRFVPDPSWYEHLSVSSWHTQLVSRLWY